jgi:PAS domain S-box-containing protein
VIESDFQTFEAVGALIVVLDVEDRVVYWNRCCSTLSGYSLEEIQGRKLWEFVLPPEEMDSEKAVFATLKTAGLPSTSANHWITTTGDRRWIVWSHALTRNTDGTIQYVIKSGIDRTDEATLGAMAAEHSRLYEKARRAADDLLEANQHMVRATIQAQELTEQVEAALKRAEASERELRVVAEFREMFIGVLGHDLRTPITAIHLSAQALVRHGHLDDHDRRAAERIVGGSERVTRMIFQLLELTRGRLGGGFPLEPKLSDLREVCRSVAEEFGPAVLLEVEGNVSGVWDPDRLAEALSNIARNATEHATPGTGVVLKARPEGTEVVVEIINHGEPIPADVLPFIFEPFRRAPYQKKSKAGNLGLGLYIANQIVGSGGGKLLAYSADGKTTFLMRLPRHPPAEAHNQSGSPSDSDQHAVSRAPPTQ